MIKLVLIMCISLILLFLILIYIGIGLQKIITLYCAILIIFSVMLLFEYLRKKNTTGGK
jgi:hypothetical protein